jgi:SCY1-like protein 2
MNMNPQPAMTPPGVSMNAGILAPSKPAQPSWGSSASSGKNDWGDFDPLA